MSDSTYWTVTHIVGILTYVVLLVTSAVSEANGSASAFSGSFSNPSYDAGSSFAQFNQEASTANLPFGSIAIGVIGAFFNFCITIAFSRVQKTGTRHMTAVRKLHRQKIVLITAILGNVAFICADVAFAAALASAGVAQFTPGVAGAAIAAVGGLAMVVVDIIGFVDLRKERRQVVEQSNEPFKEPERIEEGSGVGANAGDWTLHNQRPPPYDSLA